MADHENAIYRTLLDGARAGRLTRREVLKRGLFFGLSTPAILNLLAACGGSDGGDQNAAPTSSSGGSDSTPSGGSGDSGGGRNESSNREFVFAVNGGVPDLDPQSAYDNVASSLFLATYEMLIRFKGESTFEFEPMLAKSWEHNDDYTEFTFEFDEGIKFHDGTTCDAEAVKASFTRFLLMGRGPVGVISRFIDDPERQMQVVNPTTLKFIMNKPEPLFLPAMASEYGPLVVSPAAMEEHKTDSDPFAHEWFSQNMVGTGPYKVTEASPQDRFVLDRFEDYHGTPPFFDRIIARVIPEDATRRQLLEAGEVHGTAILPPEDLDALKENPDIQVVEYESTQTNWVRMNYVTIPDPRARQGLAYAWPYNEVIEQVLRGYAKVQGPVADSVIGYDPSIPVYSTDLQKAKELLTAAGIEEGTTFTYMYATGDATSAAMAQLFQANLAEIGINLELMQVDRAAYLEMEYGDAPAEERPHFVANIWWPDYNDPWSQLYPNFHSDSIGSKGSNSSYYANKEVDALLDQMRDASTEDEIREATRKVLQIMMWDDPAAIFYAQIRKATVLRADIRGFIPNGIYINSYNFNNMWREAT
ncbi:ABC transporter substrate-binding protein [Sphaerobacter thermophilus]|jgi:peptide/nickel transport system substrate-binding protein|uniref:Extracellular solute-binding protein family 5 n=1 Tax=Sphaerobacter thermophilus (strain ATCC 49802 / DSM 20745 / KCCM 41009 / NCIMB 13125 / S 6022) TaxID=479434 RepID=D1C6K1_SPHTD|nr:ABC transporter substrate-binding protein [Sphaerobacter thermophilus]ACZ39626.1 extracellular solute-binding protein family 5 [Sphaerobacter thermophilus DSM 20745]PZN62698.1 MAG: ABC transporter substrate-binding protein [Sphaerobacter thermophilus]